MHVCESVVRCVGVSDKIKPLGFAMTYPNSHVNSTTHMRNFMR